jgi:hypothetical protein
VRAVQKPEDVELDHELPLRQRSTGRWTEEHNAIPEEAFVVKRDLT